MLAWAKRHGSAAWGGSATCKRPDRRQHLLTQSEGLPVAIIAQQAKTECGQWRPPYQKPVPEPTGMTASAEAEVKTATESPEAATCPLSKLRRSVLGPYGVYCLPALGRRLRSHPEPPGVQRTVGYLAVFHLVPSVHTVEAITANCSQRRDISAISFHRPGRSVY